MNIDEEINMNNNYNDSNENDPAIFAMRMMQETMSGVAEGMNINEDDVVDMVKETRIKNKIKLMNTLKEGRESGGKEGYISLEELRKKVFVKIA